MAALGVRFGGNNALRSGDDLSQNHRRLPLPRNARPMTISSHVHSGAVKISSTLAKSKSKSRLCLEEFGGGKIESLTREKMDEWMRESVSEIVKNLREAPLLVEVYSDRNGGGTKLKTEKAVAEDWPHIEANWKIGEAQSPEGIMLVEELNNEDEDDDNENDDDEENTKLWGVVIQGKEANCGPCCYLLKTSRVSSNLGFFCTHFCLIKVKSFRETAESQFKNSWLVH
ncbi:hypothetical protein AAG906_008467 [Vitis piasezkii]